MPIFVLRHERRFSSPKFFSSLTPKGLENSNLLITKIKDLQIDEVFCSPFLRTIQTITPYVKETNQKINIEYALYEAVKQNTFTKDDYLHSHEELFDKESDTKQLINNNYKSYFSPIDINYPENLDKIYARVIPFLDSLKKNSNDKNILLVTHMTTALTIKEYLVNNSKLLTDMDPTGKLFPMGNVERVF